MQVTKENKNWSWKGAISFWFIIVLLTLFVFSLVQFYFRDILDIPQGVWVGLILTEIGVASISLYFALGYNKGTLTELGIKRPSTKWLILAIALAPALLMVASLVLILQIELFGDIPNLDEYERLLLPTTLPALIGWVIIDLVFVGPAEELFARGVVQKGLQNSTNSEILPIILSGLLFGLWHLDPYRIAAISVIGMGIAYVYKKSGNNLIVVALLHGVYDAFAMILAYIAI